MAKEDAKNTWFHYAKRATWNLLGAAVLLFLVETFIWKGFAHPTHHLKPIYMALSVIFIVVFAVVAVVLICIAVFDCMDMYDTVRGRTVLKPTAAEDRPNAVLEQV